MYSIHLAYETCQETVQMIHKSSSFSLAHIDALVSLPLLKSQGITYLCKPFYVMEWQS